jgi:two-component system nitrate/nitrite response regulator NarL
MERIMLVEDHAALRQTMAMVLGMEPDFEVVGQAGSLAEAREVVGRLGASSVDLAIVDLDLPDGKGIELIPEITEANPDFSAVVLTASLERGDIARAVETGAAGVLHKSADLDDVISAVRNVVEGGSLLSDAEVAELLRVASRTREEEREAQEAAKRLTRRELEVLQNLAEGLSNKEIAQKMHVSVETERSHMMSILSKLGAHSRLQALLFAARHGIVKVR